MIRTLGEIIKNSEETRESIALLEARYREMKHRDVAHMYDADERKEHFKEMNSIQTRLIFLKGMKSTLDYILNYDVNIETSPTYYFNNERINVEK